MLKYTNIFIKHGLCHNCEFLNKDSIECNYDNKSQPEIKLEVYLEMYLQESTCSNFKQENKNAIFYE